MLWYSAAADECPTQSRSQYSGWCRSAKPPSISERTKFSVSAARSYPRSIICGSGVRSSAVNPLRLTRSPRKLGKVTPSRVSVSAERGFAYCPAMRPTRMTGFFIP